ncbi:protein S-acyltransferase 11-like [Impatiens glandulifera]|uniref:protein S-acyltransferase 11-like n=1 Tax=Impatiens glandulifera TaxID=253017 RepID=UPI001FB067FC|nr:protein S-acyltransferase 11-like [Impatiens glandulifera]XP_047338205.1 protein S-acyltransferase 11-like [Impatiens glandulifera]
MKEEFHMTSVNDGHEKICWGCGSRLLLSSNAPIFKCGWCGSITNQNILRVKDNGFWWRRLRDRSFVFFLIIFMLFVICCGCWTISPVLYSLSMFLRIFHSVVIIILSVCTMSTFCFAAFKCAGEPPSIIWGSYTLVEKGGLDNYTFCHFCSKPKSPRTHHCRSCRMCILDMDHHCPFIGNCVGFANHRSFIAFLILAIISTFYVSIMSAYTVFSMFPPLRFTTTSLSPWEGFSSMFALGMIKEIGLAFLTSALMLSTRGLILVYLFISSVSIEIGLSVLLWQQLCYIYEGDTYLSSLRRGNQANRDKDCQNIVRFFGCPYSIFRYFPSSWSSRKRHRK